MSIYLDRIHERQRRKDIAREYKLVEKFFTPKHLQEEASMKKYERFVCKEGVPGHDHMAEVNRDPTLFTSRSL